MKLSRLEQETIILWNEAEAYAEVYTHNIALQNQLLKLCEARPDEVRQTEQNSHGGMSFHLPKRWVKVSPPRIPTPAQLEALERMTQKRMGGKHQERKK